jgi:hypothetical protein
MLKIRKEQMQVFGEFMLQRFKDRMVRHLRTDFLLQLEKMTVEQLRILVDNGIKKAARYGINTEDDVQHFLEYMVVYSPDFDTNPETSWAGDILSRRDMEGVSKMINLKKFAPIKGKA